MGQSYSERLSALVDALKCLRQAVLEELGPVLKPMLSVFMWVAGRRSDREK